MNKITIFTDGSSRGNPGPGGWGSVIIKEKDIIELGDREDNTTNNRMEITAAINALNNVGFDSAVDIYTDSSYLINGITKWVSGWRRNGWVTKGKEEVLNRDLWEKLVEAIDSKTVEWKYIGGHSGIAGNERCDEIATAFADNKKIKMYSGSKDEYPIRNILDLSIDEKKFASKSHSKAKAYSYISMIDGEIKTHKTWSECEARVKGKTKAKFKKAISIEHEKEIIEEFQKHYLPK